MAMTPLARPLHLGLKGKDVTAVQLALRNAGFRKRDPTGRYGSATKQQVGDFKRKKGIRNEEGYQGKTHKALWPSFGVTARRLYKEAYSNAHQLSTIDKIVQAAMYGWAHRDVIHYSQGPNRMKDFGCPPNVPNYTDCSAFVTWCYKCGGGPDPNGFGFNGYGYTGTLILHGHRVPLSSLRKGDLVFYGSGVPYHVSIYVGDGKVVSHGSEAGPLLLPFGYAAVSQARRYV